MKFFTISYIALFSIVYGGQDVYAKEIVLPPKETLEKKSPKELFELAYEYADEDLFTALKLIDIAKKNAEKNNLNQDIKECYRAIGYVYEGQNLLQKAIYAYNQALEITGIPKEQKAIICNDIASVYRKCGNYEKATDFHQKALVLAEESQDAETLEIIYNDLGAFNNTINNNEKAVEFYLKSLKYAESRPNNELGIIISLRNLSEIYTAENHHDLALQSIEKAYFWAKKSNEAETIARVLVSYSTILADMGKMDEAYKKINEVLVLLGDKPEFAATKIFALRKMGDILLKEKEYDKAEYYYTVCLSKKENMSPAMLSSIYDNYGAIFLKRENYKMALFHFEKGLKIATEYQLIFYVQKIHQSMYEVFSQKKDTKMAFFHLERANLLRDSLHSDDQNKHLAELQMQYDFNKSEKQVEDLKTNQSRIFSLAVGGSVFFVLCFLSFFVWIKGKNNKILLQKSNEIQLQNNKLEESNDVLKQFAYASAHDLKEPLRNIGNFVTLIQRRYGKELPEEALEYMDYVSKGTKKMNLLLEDLLLYSTLIATSEQRNESCNLSNIMEDVRANLQANIADSHALIVENNTDFKIPISQLHATQLLQNLLSNALKFVDKQSPIVSINCENRSDFTQISLKDNGIGIEKEYSEKIFNLFQRLNKNDVRYEGTGVGLAICKNIVEKYNGRIWFESVENQGTTFFVAFPNS